MSDFKNSYEVYHSSLENEHSVGDVIPVPDAGNPRIVGAGAGLERYLLAAIGIDRFGRVWRQDHDGLTMVADFGKAAAK